MLQNTWSVSQAPLWNCFKEHFQLQKEKECLDGGKKLNSTVAARTLILIETEQLAENVQGHLACKLNFLAKHPLLRLSWNSK